MPFNLFTLSDHFPAIGRWLGRVFRMIVRCVRLAVSRKWRPEVLSVRVVALPPFSRSYFQVAWKASGFTHVVIADKIRTFSKHGIVLDFERLEKPVSIRFAGLTGSVYKTLRIPVVLNLDTTSFKVQRLYEHPHFLPPRLVPQVISFSNARCISNIHPRLVTPVKPIIVQRLKQIQALRLQVNAYAFPELPQ